MEDRQRDTLLYAGLLQVRITDWFFFKDKADLKYIGLQNAVINFNRKDSIWNYAFLEKYFASGGKGKKSNAGLEFNLKEVVMNNVTFSQKDAWTGTDMLVKAGSLTVEANDISITTKNIYISRLSIGAPLFQTYSYAGAQPVAAPVAKDSVKTTDSLARWNPQNWNVVIGTLSVEGGRYKTDVQGSAPEEGYFDARHIDFSGINGTINGFRLVSDTLRADINLGTTERSGLQVQSLQTALRIHPQLMEFGNLYLKTNRSVLGNYLAMKFDNISSMSNFIHAVTMEAHFEKAQLSSNDVAFFAPAMKSWNRNLTINGDVKGTVDALTGKGITIAAGRNTSLTGNFNIVGLPNINQTYIHVEAKELRTTYSDAALFVPAVKDIKNPNLSRISHLHFSGNYTGFINDFVTYGTLHTNLGTLVTDINMKLPAGGEPLYSGSIATTNFQLGRLMNNNQLGLISFKGDLKGRGFTASTLSTTINGTIKKIQYGNYTYQNITATGKFSNGLLDGDFKIKDPNADLHLTGLIDVSGATPDFNIKADVVHANLGALQLTKNDLEVSGKFNLNFRGNNLSSVLGGATFSNAVLRQGGKRISFDSLQITSAVLNGVRTLRARSAEFDATVAGKFDLETLPGAFTLFLSRYYPSYITVPTRNIPKQSFTFDITTGVVEDYIKLVDNRLSGFNNSRITGSLNIDSNTLNLDADVPHFSFSQYQFSDVTLKGSGNFQKLMVRGAVNNAIISDSVLFPQTTFTLEAQNDVSAFTINTTANQAINQANLSAQIKTFSNGASVLFNPSSFVLNGKTWNIEQGGELDFRKNAVVQGQLALKESNQEVRISTQPSDVGNWNDLHVALQNVNLGDLSPLLLKANRIEGLLSGEINVEDPQNKFNISSNIRTEGLRLDADSIGEVQASLSYNNKTGLLTGEGGNTDPLHQLLFNLSLDFKDSSNQHQDRISVQPVNYPVKILERFIGTLFSNLQGYITGKLDIVGEGASRDYIGKAALKDAGLKVNFTQVSYKIDDTEIELTENEIDLGRLKLRDTLGNTATVRGNIKHKSFGNMVFDIVAEVDGKPMELLNTTYNDNQTFYGKALGTGSLILTGPLNDMFMQITAKPSERDSSYITLPPSRTRESGAANFMVERKYGREMTEQDFQKASSNITYEVDITANPFVNIEVILDDLTGDAIRGRGVGNIVLRAGTSEPLSIRGRYDIKEGSYLFTFQSFFKKPFVLKPESANYIEWTGDPYSAMIHFDAVYKAEDVSFAPLASSLGFGDRNGNRGLASYRDDVNVVVALSGELFRPAFTFKLEFPSTSIVYTDPSLAFGIQQIEKNTNEINKQVTYLIVFNSFAPYGAQLSSANPLNELAYSTISGLFFNEVNKRLNQLLSKILQNNDLTFNFTGSLYNRNLVNQSSSFDINQSNFNISVGKALLNERVLINLGGTFDVPLQSSIQQKIQLLPDVNVEFLINKSGSVRATFFYSHSPDPLISGAQTGTLRKRAGAKVSYRKEFDSLSKFLFGRRKGKLKKSDSTGKDSANGLTNDR